MNYIKSQLVFDIYINHIKKFNCLKQGMRSSHGVSSTKKKEVFLMVINVQVAMWLSPVSDLTLILTILLFTV